jgi:hypothetical protein
MIQLVSHVVQDRPAVIGDWEVRLKEADEQAEEYVKEHGQLRSGIVRRTDGSPRRTTVDALVGSKRLRRLNGNRNIDPADVSAAGHFHVLGPSEVNAGRECPERRIDRLVLATRYHQVMLTQPGDVIYTTTPTLAVMLDVHGSCLIESPARGLRINKRSALGLTGRVLAALLTAAQGMGRGSSNVRAGRRVGELDLPDLDEYDAMRMDAVLTEIDLRIRLLTDQTVPLAEIHRLAIAGFADGTLTVEPT